jgi:hypothetical protein
VPTLATLRSALLILSDNRRRPRRTKIDANIGPEVNAWPIGTVAPRSADKSGCCLKESPDHRMRMVGTRRQLWNEQCRYEKSVLRECKDPSFAVCIPANDTQPCFEQPLLILGVQPKLQ